MTVLATAAGLPPALAGKSEVRKTSSDPAGKFEFKLKTR